MVLLPLLQIIKLRFFKESLLVDRDRALGFSTIRKIIFFMKDILKGISIMDMGKLPFIRDSLERVWDQAMAFINKKYNGKTNNCRLKLDIKDNGSLISLMDMEC